MKILIIGAGQVGATVIGALHDAHELTVLDVDAGRLNALSHRHDVKIVEGSGTSRRSLQEAGLPEMDLLIACTSRDEVNVIAALFSKKLSPETKTIVRTTNMEYLEVWHERQLDVDFMVSSELETAHAVSAIIGIPAARQTDVFADGQVQIVEFDIAPVQQVDRGRRLVEAAKRRHARGRDEVIGRRLREAQIPKDSKVASIIRGDQLIVPRGDEEIRDGDRIIVIGSPEAAREWSELIAPDARRVDDVVIYGCGRIGTAVARVLLDQNLHVRMVETDRARAQQTAEELPDARIFNATGLDADFLERERIGNARAAIFAMRDDAKNHYAATLAKLHGVDFTIAIVHDAVSIPVFERAGIDVALNPREVTAEEIVRHAHDPRTQQVVMLEGDRYEVLDVYVRPESTLVDKPFRELPMTGALIGAIIRGGKAVFPHGDDVLMPGDRVIVFTEARRAAEVEAAL
ncbi:MAG: Trk system potassium transporter TrkA [Actinomycetota bacterium]|nr:Trk system potassium transporter TrkA [Actinomycetota bacterium]